MESFVVDTPESSPSNAFTPLVPEPDKCGATGKEKQEVETSSLALDKKFGDNELYSLPEYMRQDWSSELLLEYVYRSQDLR